jgi:hypothetical protein
MKFPAFHSSRLCKVCKQHQTKFTFRGHVKRDPQHDICHRCYRSLTDRNAAQQLTRVAASRSRITSLATSQYFYRQLLHQPWVAGAGNHSV